MKKALLTYLLFLYAHFCNAQTITTIAGGGTNTAENIPATSASLGFFFGMACDELGNIYVADGFHRIRKIDITSGLINTIAGTGVAGYNGDGIIATTAQLDLPGWMVIDKHSNLFFLDGNNYRIRKIDLHTGIISTIAGNGVQGYCIDGSKADTGRISGGALTCDTLGNIYFLDGNNYRVRKINTDGIITTIVGNGVHSNTGDGGDCSAATISGSLGISMNKHNEIFFSTDSQSVRFVNLNTMKIFRFAGTGNGIGIPYLGDGISALSSHINPYGLAIDGIDNVFIADPTNQRIEKVGTSTLIETIAGIGSSGYSGDNGNANLAKVNYPENVIVDDCNNVYIADFMNKRIRKVTYNPIPCSYLNIENQDFGNAITENIGVQLIYPNPTQNYLHIDGPNIHDILIDDLVGRQFLIKSFNNKITIDFSNYPTGIYLIKLRHNDGSVSVHRVVKK